MKTYLLTEQNGFADPYLFNRMRGGGRVKAVVEDGGLVVVHGVPLKFRDAHDAPAAGAEVQVWLVRDYVCATEAELAHDDKIREERRLAKEEEWRQRRNQYRLEAEEANASIKLPFKWVVAIKDVLSGLSETSSCDGRNKATVNHILLLEDVNAGRLKRKERDFLCTSASGSNGKRWSNQSEEALAVDGDGNEYTPPVTCKQCLRVAETMTLQNVAKQAAQGVSVTGFNNVEVSAAMQKKLSESFLRNGDSFHSGKGETAWVIMEHCERSRIPYRVEVSRINGAPAGVRVVRVDREVPPTSNDDLGMTVEVIKEWKPELPSSKNNIPSSDVAPC